MKSRLLSGLMFFFAPFSAHAGTEAGVFMDAIQSSSPQSDPQIVLIHLNRAKARGSEVLENFLEQKRAGWSALGLAAAHGNAQVVEGLLSAGAKVSEGYVSGDRKLSPLILAAQNEKDDVIETFLASPRYTLEQLKKDIQTAHLLKQPDLAAALSEVLLDQVREGRIPAPECLKESQSQYLYDVQAQTYLAMDVTCAICVDVPGSGMNEADIRKSGIGGKRKRTGDSAITQCCHKFFCSSCLTNLLNRNIHRCPQCRHEPFGHQSYTKIEKPSEELLRWRVASAGGTDKLPLPVSQPAFAAAPVAGLQNLGGIAGLTPVSLPGGSFRMGSPTDEEGRYGWEEAPHPETVPAFKVMDTHLTRGQLKAIGFTPHLRGCGGLSAEDKANWGKPENEDLPATCISWDDTQEIIQKLAAKGVHSRMITETEAEYLARLGEGKVIHQGPYPFNKARLGDYAVYSENSGGKMQKVRSKLAIEGVYDARGNVYTWTDTLNGSGRVFRGARCVHDARLLRSACRAHDRSGVRLAYVGVRLAIL